MVALKKEANSKPSRETGGSAEDCQEIYTLGIEENEKGVF